MSVAENLERVREEITQAARQAGREPSDVRLVAMSKSQELELVRQALDAGQTLFGENYVQEAQGKSQALGSDPQWHLTGHLQSNKARLAAEVFSAVQSVHSVKLAKALNRRALELDKRLTVLLQVNVGGEAQKSGCASCDAAALAQAVAEMHGLALKGLMTLPPWTDKAEEARSYFAELRQLAESLAPNLPPGSMDELSMGMSDDFMVAIAEGATLVRVGTAIFGERYYGPKK